MPQFSPRAFIGAADCGRQVESHVEKAVEKAGETINLIPNLRQTSVQFEEKSQVRKGSMAFCFNTTWAEERGECLPDFEFPPEF